MPPAPTSNRSRLLTSAVSRGRAGLVAVAVVVVASLLALLVLELVLLATTRKPWVGGYSPHVGAGTSLTPGATGWWTEEGRGFVEVNSAGMRDSREYPMPVPADVIRIALIGDSFVEALQVNEEDAHFRLLEGLLNERCAVPGGQRVEVLPFGVSGHGVPQYLRTWQNRAVPLGATAGVIVVTTGNDWRNASRSLEGDPYRPYLIRSESTGQFVWDDSFRQTDWFAAPTASQSVHGIGRTTPLWIKQLRTYQLVRGAARRIVPAIQAARAGVALVGLAPASAQGRDDERVTMSADAPAPLEPGSDAWVYFPRERQPLAWQEAADATHEAIRRLGGEDAPILIAAGTSGAQVHPDPRVATQSAAALGVADLREPDRLLERWATESGLPFTALAPPLAATAQQSGVGLHGESPDWGGHWNAAGHSAVAQALAPATCALIGGEMSPVG